MFETKIDPINPVLIADLSGFSLKSRSTRFIDFARNALKEAEQTNERALGYVPNHLTYADGKRIGDPNLEWIKPENTITFVFSTGGTAFGWIADQLIIHSPVRTGRYQNSHVFLRDGVIADPKERVGELGLTDCMFVSNAPYSRKIERGESPQDPAGVYEAVAAMARDRYGDASVSISFAYVDPPAAAGIPSRSTRRHYPGSTGKVPAIVIKVQSLRAGSFMSGPLK